MKRSTILVVFLIGIPVFAWSIFLTNNIQMDLREGCERGNIRSSVQYEFLKIAQADGQDSSDEDIVTDPEQAAIDQRAADRYSSLANDLVEAAASYSERPGSVEINCVEAYPRSFPINIVMD